MTPPDPSNYSPEAAAAERLRQHLEEIARERDSAHRALQEREAELARIQRIGRVGGSRSISATVSKIAAPPNISSFMGCRRMRPMRPRELGQPNPSRRSRADGQAFLRRVEGRKRGLFSRIPHHAAKRRPNAMDRRRRQDRARQRRPRAAPGRRRISTSPIECWRRKPCAKARSAFA